MGSKTTRVVDQQEKKNLQTDTREDGHAKMKVRTGAIRPQPWVPWSLERVPELTKGKKEFPVEVFGRNAALLTLEF